jgi:hypothetical protein
VNDLVTTHLARAAIAIRLVALVGLVLVTPGHVLATTFGPLLDCPPIATMKTIVSLRDRPGPLAAAYDEPMLNEQALACFGARQLTILAFRAAPEGLGGAVSYAVEPSWLDTWQEGRFFVALSDKEIEPGFVEGPFLAVAVPPDLQDQFAALAGRWISMTGHFDDPAAGTCRLAGDPVPVGGQIPTPADVVEMCRTAFGISAIAAVESPCPRPPFDWSAISQTPEHLRARCFGDGQLSFTARGYTVTVAWPLLGPIGNDWELIDPNGGRDPAIERARAVEAFGPPPNEIATPSDAPWLGTDGIGGYDVLWDVRGHFDDPAASDCRPNGDGAIVDGQRVDWSPEEAVEFCRNHLFIEAMTWIRAPVPSGQASSPPSDDAVRSQAPPAASNAPSTQPSSGPAQSSVLLVVAALAMVAILAALVARAVRNAIARRRVR